jgi:hypothetical protein
MQEFLTFTKEKSTMIPGPFSVCRVEHIEGSDELVFHDISYGYDTAEQAALYAESIAAEENLSINDLAVIQVWSIDELKRNSKS